MMETANVIALIGIIVTAGIALGAIWRHLATKISDNTATLHDRVDDTAKILNARIDKSREDHVRRDELMGHVSRIEEGQRTIIAAQGATNSRLDNMMMHWSKVGVPPNNDK